tara:strand:+ start:3105 stop:3950 length:846 start_codon:yes stop_codon:yes gene_type:complete
MKVAIVGYGFVGKALENGIDGSVSILNIDPKLKTSIKDLVDFQPNIIFICVPTPLCEDLSLDASIVHSVIDEILEHTIDSLIVLKSTILPNHLEKISKRVKRFIYNPEFLREKHANKDFLNSNLIVFGGEPKNINEIRDFYNKKTKCICKSYVETDLVSASLIKYTINSFLATKVSFFNELKNVFVKVGAKDTWDNFIKYLQKDSRLGDSHMSVPGHDGKEGFGGACLPKDSLALLNFYKENNLDFKVLKSAIDVNNIIREKYNDDPREMEQRINFKKEIT